MPARTAKMAAIAGCTMNRKFKLPDGRARKLSHPRAIMPMIVVMSM
jgi:hypothetical protein